MAAIIESAANDVLEQHAKLLQDDLPTIGNAIKNLIAMLLGRATADPSTSSMFENDATFTPIIGLTCGRCLLQAIERYELLNPIEHTTTHPQRDDQPGEARLNEIIQYKCLFTLATQARNAGGKRSTLFGRRWFLWSGAWSHIKTSIVPPAATIVPSDIFHFFLNTFENTLLIDLDGIDLSNDAHLVWAIDFNQVLRQRQLQRKEDAAQRVRNEADAADDWSEEDEVTSGAMEVYKTVSHILYDWIFT